MSARASATRQRQSPVGEMRPDELLVRLRLIVTSEQTSCQLLQLELAAAIQSINPDTTTGRRAEAVLMALAEAQKAYGKLLAELGGPARL